MLQNDMNTLNYMCTTIDLHTHTHTHIAHTHTHTHIANPIHLSCHPHTLPPDRRSRRCTVRPPVQICCAHTPGIEGREEQGGRE